MSYLPLPFFRLSSSLALALIVSLGTALPTMAGDVQASSTSVSSGESLADADRLMTQSDQLRQQAKYSEAVPLVQQALAIREKALGSEHLDVATSLNSLGLLYFLQGNYATAEPLYKRALAIREKALGSEHPDVASSLNNLGKLYRNQGKYPEAEPLYKRALAIREKALGTEHPDVAQSLSNLAVLYSDQGKYGEAELLHKRALAIREKTLGLEHPDVAISLNNLAILPLLQGKYAEAEPLFKRSLAIREKVLDPEHPDVAQSLENLAVLYLYQGKYGEAEPLFKRALAIHEKALGLEHPAVANNLTNLGELHRNQGKYSEAEPLYKRALAIREKALGSEHFDVAQSLNNLAILYTYQGKYTAAEPLFKRALAIREKALGLGHQAVAQSLNNLGELYRNQGKYSESELLFKRALAISEKALGSEHPDVASNLNNLADLYTYQGKYTEVESLYKRALAIREKALGLEHPDVAESLNNLADLYTYQGKYTAAEPLYKRALAIREKALGSEHPVVAISLNSLAVLRSEQEYFDDARLLLARSLNIEEKNLNLNLTSGAEAQKQESIALLSDSTNFVVWLDFAHTPHQLASTRLALTTLLRRKGRILDTLTTNLAIFRGHLTPGIQTLLDQLTQNRTQLATLTFGSRGTESPETFKATWQKLNVQTQQLEGQLADLNSQFRQQTRPIALEDVQRQLPKHSVLIELVRYRPFNLKAKKKVERFALPRYAAYLLFPGGEPIGIDLGEAATIDQQRDRLVSLLRDRLSFPTELRTTSNKLYTALWKPIQQKLPINTRKLLISPDGPLHLLPFAALADAKGRYLIERYEISYLASGRDLLRLADPPVPSHDSPLIVGAPDFEHSQTVLLATGTERSTELARSSELGNLSLLPLPGTGKEATAIAALLPNARLLTGAEATENALKATQRPQILHFATHGFFLKDATARGVAISGSGSENPLLRSGLALAGFNQRSSGAEDGVLTALEAAGLDLAGTQMVVLSACDTGLGDVSNGEGVYGLRRAFTIAGARSQVFSLWKVDDQAAVELMSGFYRRLLAGVGRGEALRQMQIRLLHRGEHRHPYWWAGFVETGEWRPLKFSSSSPSR